MTEYVLGLDLGSNSVGWALISQDGRPFPNGLPVLAGVRVFPEGVDKLNTKKEKPRGQDRRLARGQRRQHQRRRQRRGQLLAILAAANLLPRDPAERQRALEAEPYGLRVRGLDGKLSPHEVGRALFHLCQRRGFKSNRKQEKSKDDGDVAKETAELRKQMDGAGARTLGEYLADLGKAFRHDGLDCERIRDRYTLRTMYEEEFEKLWAAQAAHHVGLLTDELKAEVRRAIFFQRPLRFDPDVIGECELEPGEKRCARAHWLAQQFRILQEINLLKVLDAGGEERALRPEERATLALALSPKKEMTFGQIRELLGFFETQTFNLEDLSKRTKLNGNPVEYALTRKPLDKWYGALSPETRRQVHDALAEEEDEDRLAARARGEWGADEAQARKLAGISLPAGHFKVSLKAIEKIMPHLEAGCVYSAAKEAAGYSLARTIEAQDSLPPVDDLLPNLTNPLVHRALGEARKVVNAIVREHGRPARIVVELARDMKNAPKKRRELFWENVERREENEAIRERIRSDFPSVSSPSRDDVIKYKLWKECGEVCPYTGRSIPASKLFTGEVQIEHILPYSWTLDDSYMNKSLCYEDENRHKHNRTPVEAYGDNPARFDPILQRVAKSGMPYPKKRKFSQKEVDLDACVQRQLNDTRYISRAAVDYLRTLYGNTPGEIRVRCVKGGTTAELRHQWGLDEILGLRGEKNRLDHRHHAVDAGVIALTTPSALQRLSSVKYNPQRPQLDAPWETFRDDLAAAVNAINVSHRSCRKLAGALHEETALGPGQGKDKYVHRVPVENLTANMIEGIRDRVVREIIQQAVAERGLGKALVNPPVRVKSKKGLGPPIKTVRVGTTEKTVIPLRKDEQGHLIKGVLSGSNHHVEIYETKNDKGEIIWTGHAVARFEAHQRLLRKQAVVIREPGDGSKLVMSLHINDMVRLTDPAAGAKKLYRVQKMSIIDGQPYLVFRLHTAARIEDDQEMCRVQSWGKMISLRPEKVTVDPLGRIHPCND